jgi:predicted transcriptional regulator
MKRLQIMIDEDLDQALDRLALRQRCSKAALIRRFVREQIQPLPPVEDDPITIGAWHGDEDDSLSVNDVVYPR